MSYSGCGFQINLICYLKNVKNILTKVSWVGQLLLILDWFPPRNQPLIYNMNWQIGSVSKSQKLNLLFYSLSPRKLHREFSISFTLEQKAHYTDTLYFWAPILYKTYNIHIYEDWRIMQLNTWHWVCVNAFTWGKTLKDRYWSVLKKKKAKVGIFCFWNVWVNLKCLLEDNLEILKGILQ